MDSYCVICYERPAVLLCNCDSVLICVECLGQHIVSNKSQKHQQIYIQQGNGTADNSPAAEEDLSLIRQRISRDVESLEDFKRVVSEDLDKAKSAYISWITKGFNKAKKAFVQLCTKNIERLTILQSNAADPQVQSGSSMRFYKTQPESQSILNLWHHVSYPPNEQFKVPLKCKVQIQDDPEVIENKAPAELVEIIKTIEEGLQPNNILELSGMEISIHGARYLASKIPSILSLQILSITHTPIPIEGVQALFNRFKFIPMLNTLDLSRDAISFQSSPEVFHNLTFLTNLRHLILSNNIIGDLGIDSLIASLQYNTTLVSLNLDNSQMKMGSFQRLCDFLPKLKNLRELCVKDNHLSQSCAQMLSQSMHQLKQIVRLDLSYNDISHEGFIRVSMPLEYFLNLQSLSLNSCKLGPDSLNRLSEVLYYLTQLENLCLGFNGLGFSNGFIKIFKAIENHKFLETLYIPKNGVTTQDVIYYSSHLQSNQSLKKLFLHRNSINMNGMQALCNSLINLPGFNYLDARFNLIEGFEAEEIRSKLNYAFKINL